VERGAVEDRVATVEHRPAHGLEVALDEGAAEVAQAAGPGRRADEGDVVVVALAQEARKSPADEARATRDDRLHALAARSRPSRGRVLRARSDARPETP